MGDRGSGDGRVRKETREYRLCHLRKGRGENY